MKVRTAVLGAAAAIVLAACVSNSVPPASQAGLSDADRASLQALTDSVVSSIRARNWDAFVSTFSEDVVFMPPNHPALRGRAALRAWADSNPVFSDFGFSNATFDGAGDMAWGSTGIHLAFTPPGGKLVADTAKQVFVARKQADGSWKTVVVAFNSDLPMPGAPPPPPARQGPAKK
jgi:ketosteroid isomerase-like protein